MVASFYETLKISYNANREGKKKVFEYVDDDRKATHQSGYSRRSTTVIDSLKEMHITFKTECAVKILPQEGDGGNPRIFVTPKFRVRSISRDRVEQESEDSEILEQDSIVDTTGNDDNTTSSDESPNNTPEKRQRHNVVISKRPQFAARLNNFGGNLGGGGACGSNRTKKQCCQVCQKQEEHGYWLGCGHVNGKGEQDCEFWVHQFCVHLYYRNKKELDKVPFYCPKHGLDVCKKHFPATLKK